MAKAIRLNGLHHATSLGNIEISSTNGNIQIESRCYDSEDESMARRRGRQSPIPFFPRTSIYSKGDIREQYCLTDKQLNTIERPRRERLFGCLSGKGAQQSFLGGCVGRRAPSDENLADAPFYKYPRYHHHQSSHPVISYDDDIENSYFRRRPASILSSGSSSRDARRYTWMSSGGNSVRIEDIRPAFQNEYENFNRGPYVVETYPPKAFLSQSSEQIARGMYRCPAHVGLPPAPPPPLSDLTAPRTKHVSFARSHTLTSFDEASMGLRSSGRLKTARSQERLIGGKKAILTAGMHQQPAVPQQIPIVIGPQHHHVQQHQQNMHNLVHQQQAVTTFHPYHQILVPIQPQLPTVHTPQRKIAQHHHHHHHQHNVTGGTIEDIIAHQIIEPEVLVVEKIKRGPMKTQATQTEVHLNASTKGAISHHLSLSPRTIHRVKMVSQGAQTNGTVNGRKLTKSLSEMIGGRISNKTNDFSLKPDDPKHALDHEHLHRTQSEEPPRSPLMIPQPQVLVSSSQIFFEKPAINSDTPVLSSFLMPSLTAEKIPQSQNMYVGPHYHSETETSSYFPVSFSKTTSTASTTTTTSRNVLSDSQITLLRGDKCNSSNSLIHQDVNVEGISQTFDYECNSLPRRTCAQHRIDSDYYSYTLPRRDLQPQEVCRHITDCSELLNGTQTQLKEKLYSESSTESAIQPIEKSLEKRRASIANSNKLTSYDHAVPILRRQSMPMHMHNLPYERQNREELSSEEGELNESFCVPLRNKILTGDDESEKEIFIDFKPHISPKPSPRARRKTFQKTFSDGEILIDKQQDQRENVLNASASEDDLKTIEDPNSKEYLYQNLPIKYEGICETQHLLALPYVDNEVANLKQKREAFRKRSISLEDPGGNLEDRLAKSAPPSPCQEDLSVHGQSAYPSSDSLANDLTRDHSDGIWNESQVTVLTAEPKDSENYSAMLTPSSKRRNLLLQHQQRSSIDTDALDLEEQLHETCGSFLTPTIVKPVSTQTQPTFVDNLHQLTPIPIPIRSAPMIAVTPSTTTDSEINEPLGKSISSSRPSSRRSSRTLSPSLLERRKIEPLIHRLHDPPELSFMHQTGLDQQLLSRGDSGPKTNTDISECSTNTDDYMTCTENSKRTPGMKTPTTTTSSSSTQVPVSAQSSQTERTQQESSFESASSLYSTRGDGLSEDTPHVQESETAQIGNQPIEPQKLYSACLQNATIKQSPSHSVSSTSSGSYNQSDLIKSKSVSTPIESSVQTLPKTSLESTFIPEEIKKTFIVNQKKSESISEEEKSEKRYSSSGYYESPHDDETRAAYNRRHRQEEERRRRKNNMKLDIERENIRALTSPIKKPSPVYKQISPDDHTALNILDGTSPSKIKRFRPKVRRQFRRTSKDDTQTKKVKIPLAKSPESNFEKTQHHSPKISPSQIDKIQPCSKTQNVSKITKSEDRGSEKSLKAKSIESLRSVSPGSDSVFYSEADAVGDQVHCLHCGKEVEIVTAISGSQESIPPIEDDTKDIVKPPADFADSPITSKTSHRLYKKMDKRFRSEERHGDRGRHFKIRQDNVRAKSEERSKDNFTRSPPTIRPAGSSPCMLPDGFVNNENDQEEVIYYGNYTHGTYTRLTDSDVWIQLNHQSFDRHRDRRGSTDSERIFHSKFQVILHRLVQRRCTLEMYHRQKNKSFKLMSSTSTPESVRRKLEDVLKLMLVVWARTGQAIKSVSGKENEIDKTVVVSSASGEFGFRIHGSKPVVVAAIEPDTPAETSGLEVGDIIISVNGIAVLDKHHTEVVKIAHAGCEILELEVARTIGVLMNEQQDKPSPALYTGYLWRQSGQAKGSPNSKKWVQRWFCLRSDHCLYYYKTDADTQPVGAMILTDHIVEHCSSDVGKVNAFKIDSREGIPMYLAADTEEVASRWVAVLCQASKQTDPWMELSIRNLKLPPNGIQRPDCFGYLFKLGSRWRGWSKRYCVLKDSFLYFYQDANSKNAFGMACVQGYKVMVMSSNAAGRKNAFEIVPPEPNLRHYFFCTESEMDKKRWISALEYSIDRWIKAG